MIDIVEGPAEFHAVHELGIFCCDTARNDQFFNRVHCQAVIPASTSVEPGVHRAGLSASGCIGQRFSGTNRFTGQAFVDKARS